MLLESFEQVIRLIQAIDALRWSADHCLGWSERPIPLLATPFTPA